MLDNKQLLMWAIKGISAEIDNLEKAVRQGYKMLKDLQEGKPIKSPLNATEIQFVIDKKKKEIEKLSKEQFDLRWQLSVEEK